MRAAGKVHRSLAVATLFCLVLARPVWALERLEITVAGGDEALSEAVAAVSLVRAAQDRDAVTPQDLLAAARSDYAQILAAMYAEGRYSAVISIRVDGREASDIPALEVPATISAIDIAVDPGPVFRFGTASLSPLTPGTELPEGFRPGETAESALIADALDASITGWRNAGHAKAALATQDVIADHATAELSVGLRVDPGPRLRFGRLEIEGESRMREQRVRKIAGLPEGETFSETELRRAETRLRRTGIFSSATLVEDDQITAPDLLGITAQIVEQKPRRYSVGAEVASLDGVSLTGSWLHRNLLGGGERFLLQGQIGNIGSGESGVDYELGVSLDRPATLTPDTTAGLLLRLEREDEIDYVADTVEFGLTFSHIFSDDLTGRAAVTYSYQDGEDPGGSFRFQNLALPLGLTWDRRDVDTNPTRGFYIDVTARPFLGFQTTGSGLRGTIDARGYRSLGERFVLAARAQAGGVWGPSLLETPRDLLFFSGGGGTVRGQPYRSLGISVARGFGPQFQIGGKFFAAASVELRAKVTDRIGVVGFVDAGSVGIEGLLDGDAASHAGAGLGLRYDTGIGPIRLDVAAPISGTTGDGVQIYIGLGQSF
jgi:translocation and assembly module TamA